MSKEKKDWGEKDTEWFDNFKFVVERKPSSNYQGANSFRGGGGERRGGFGQNIGGNYNGNAKNAYTHNSDRKNPQSSHSRRAHWEDDINGDPNLWVNRNDNGYNKGNRGNGSNSDGKMGGGDFEDFMEWKSQRNTRRSHSLMENTSGNDGVSNEQKRRRIMFNN